jgi:hypothetical protein
VQCTAGGHLIASLAYITTEFDALDATAFTSVPEEKMKGPFAAVPTIASLLPVAPASSRAPFSARRRSQGGWEHYLFELWSTVVRGITVPVRVVAAVTKRCRCRQRGLTR